MDISTLASGAGTALTPASAPANNTLGQEAFLQLLVTQLRNQDPLNPQDGAAFVAQLAQFSSVEQLTTLNTQIGAQGSTLSGIASALGGGQSTQNPLLGAASLIGRTAETSGGFASLGKDGDASLTFRLGNDAASGQLVVRNASGEVVRRVQFDALEAGERALSWDGLNDKGVRVPEGTYTYTVEALSSSGTVVSASAYTRGTIERVTQTAAGLAAWIGGAMIPLSALQSVAASE